MVDVKCPGLFLNDLFGVIPSFSLPISITAAARYINDRRIVDAIGTDSWRNRPFHMNFFCPDT